MGRIFGNLGMGENWLRIWSHYRVRYKRCWIFRLFYHSERRMNEWMNHCGEDYGWWSGRIWTTNDHRPVWSSHKMRKIFMIWKWTNWQKLYCLWLVTARCLFRIWTKRLSNLIYVSCGFPQSLQTNATQLLKLCHAFLLHSFSYSLITLQFIQLNAT